jgi:archaellum component FlaF (FlaF/FlaG flagellin family)
LEKPGYDPVDTNIVLTGEATIVKNLNRQYGYLKILVNDQNGELVSDANVYVNGEFKLKTPSDQELHLPVDTYAIKIERKGLVTKDTSCVIAKNVHLQFHVILRRE